VHRLVTSLVARVEMSERERALRKPTESLEAYDHCLRGKELWYRWEREANLVAQDHFHKAISLDLNFAQAYRNLSYVLIQGCLGGWVEAPQATIRQAREMAQKAVTLGPADFENYGQLGFASLYCRDFDRSLANYRKAVDLNPNSADLLADMADALIHVGKTAEGVAMIAQAKHLNPLCSDWYDWVLGIAAFHDGRFEEALAALTRVENSSSFLRCDLVATYVRLDRLDEARAVVREILDDQPTFRLTPWALTPFKDQNVLQRFIADLRLAGLPADSSQLNPA
jgi:adenylate cyclase